MKKYPDITSFIQKKNEHRKLMASLPFTEKVKIAFDLNRRHKFIKSGRLVPTSSSATPGSQHSAEYEDLPQDE